MRRPVSCLTLAAALLLVMSPAARAQDQIRVLNPTPIGLHSDIPAKVREQCHDLGRFIPAAIARANRSVTLVNTPQELRARTGRYLLLEIIEIKARGGGVFSGPKHMLVRGVAYRNGKEVGDIQASRGSTMAFSACASLEKVEKSLGQDLARWLNNPRPNDRL